MTTTLTLNGPAIRLAIEREQEDILASAGIFLQDRMVSATPEDTGRARGSITYATSRRQSRPRFPAVLKNVIDAPVAPNVVHIGTDLWYFRYLESGTSKTPARNIIQGTFERSRNAIRHLFIVGYNSALGRFR
jgi:HK97 gp10 family phage protein